MKYLITLLMLVSSTAFAADRSAVSKIDPNVTYTMTDEPCSVYPNPDEAPLKAAMGHDKASGKTIYGCAVDYGTMVEFHLVDETRTKQYTILVPSKDLQ